MTVTETTLTRPRWRNARSRPQWPGPRWAQSIKFRLALTYAVSVYAVGSLMLGGLYAYQVNQLDEPKLTYSTATLTDTSTGESIQMQVLTRNDVQTHALEMFERNVNLSAIDNLKKAALVGLMMLVVVAFIIGWVLATVTLRPINRMVAVARDITGSDLSRRIDLRGPDDELQGLADTFDAMLDRLQAAFEDQRRFVQDASHELRNPLAVARTNLELALSNPDASTADLRRSAEVAHRSTGRMSHIVEALLVQARSGVPHVEKAVIDLAGVAEEVRHQFQQPANERSITINVTADHPVLVKGDEQAIARVVINLMSNALRFAPGHSTVDVIVKADRRWAKLTVIDRGPGLSEEDQQQVFTRFWRGQNAGPGNGLGLSIVKQVVERHGGAVSVKSELGHGAAFAVTLPIAPQPTPDETRSGNGEWKEADDSMGVAATAVTNLDGAKENSGES
jgi:signal transduction histidine kinase